MTEKRKRIADDDYEVSVQKRVLKHIYGKKFWGPYLSERQWCTVREETLGNWYFYFYVFNRMKSLKIF